MFRSRLRAYLLIDPLIVVTTLVLGLASMLASTFDKRGRTQHAIASVGTHPTRGQRGAHPRRGIGEARKGRSLRAGGQSFQLHGHARGVADPTANPVLRQAGAIPDSAAGGTSAARGTSAGGARESARVAQELDRGRAAG